MRTYAHRYLYMHIQHLPIIKLHLSRIPHHGYNSAM